MLAQLAAAHPKIREQGGGIIGVGPASPAQARHLMEHSVPFPLLLDPERRLAGRVRLGRQSIWAYLFDLKAWSRYVYAFLRHRRQGWITGHYSDLPGVLVVDKDASVVEIHRGTGIADYPPVGQLLAELQGCALTQSQR